jgi:hypothetical protein
MSLTHFFMVCKAPRSAFANTHPQTRYATRAEAETVARRLARAENATFLILETVATITPPTDPTEKGLF